MLLPLDELNQADPQTVGASAYMLGNGQGKNRMNKTLSTVKPKTWELLFLSTGEVSMTDYLRQAKTPAKGGMEARMPSIPADAGKGYGVFENLQGYQSSDEFVAALETAIRQHQGTAQDAYLTKLVEARKVEGFDRELRARVQAIAGKLSQQFTDTAISRVAIRFALVQVGLELAHSFNLLPLAIEQCGWAVKQMFAAWVDIRGGAGSIEIKEACNRIEHLFVSNQHGDRVADTHNPVNVRNLLAYRHIDDLTKEAEFWVPPAIFDKELSDSVDRKGLIKELQVRGWLKPSLDERPTLRRRLEINKQQRFFVFRDFWTNDERSPSDLGNHKKVLDSVDSVDSKAESDSETEFLSSPGESSSKNESGLGGLAPEISESTESSDENSTGLGWTQPELSQGETSTMSSPLSPASPAKNRVSENASEQEREFKVGDRVKPADPYHERGQDMGIVESIEGEQYVVQWQRDRNLRRYTREELQMVA
jgi:putative DNA primase/helicase